MFDQNNPDVRYSNNIVQFAQITVFIMLCVLMIQVEQPDSTEIIPDTPVKNLYGGIMGSTKKTNRRKRSSNDEVRIQGWEMEELP